MNLQNKSNGYVDALGNLGVKGNLFESCPKTVFAAIAVSALTCGGDYLEHARERVIAEWWTLFDNGIVPQRPPFLRPKEEGR